LNEEYEKLVARDEMRQDEIEVWESSWLRKPMEQIRQPQYA
jgi:hypothetical protein